jgi:hypothetical protein
MDGDADSPLYPHGASKHVAPGDGRIWIVDGMIVIPGDSIAAVGNRPHPQYKGAVAHTVGFAAVSSSILDQQADSEMTQVGQRPEFRLAGCAPLTL